MKVIVAGSRQLNTFDMVEEAIDDFWLMGNEITEIVSGGARGVDRLGERYAQENKIPLKVFPAEWDKHGKAAGAIRNDQMANYADALIAVWDEVSRGTGHMINSARRKGLLVYVKTPGKGLRQITSGPHESSL